MSTKDQTISRPSEDSAQDPARPLLSIDSAVLKSVRVALEARLGAIEMTIDELLALEPGSVLTLDRAMNEPIELYLNGAVVARGEIVAVDDRFGVRIVEIAPIR